MNVDVQSLLVFVQSVWSDHHLKVGLLDWIVLCAWKLQIDGAWRWFQRRDLAFTAL